MPGGPARTGRMTRRGLIALTVSLGVHLSVLLWAMSDEPRPVAMRPVPPVSAAPQMKLVWLSPEPPPRPVERRVAPPPPPPKKPKPVVVVAPVTAPPGPVSEDSPRRVELAPSEARAPVAEDSGGTTLHPGDGPTEAELRAEEQERVSGRVSTLLNGVVGAARVRGGLPDPSYGQLGSELRAATDDVPKFIDTNNVKAVAGALLESWGAGAERYGKTGAPYAEPEGRLENVERPSEMANGVANGNPDMQAMATFLGAGARLQEFADGRAGLELYALVELKQQPSGALDSVTLIRPSGLRPFDAWVTERARTVGLGFSFDAGARTKALRSVWRFDGIILYRRKLKLDKLDGRAAIGMITMAALSALSAIGNTYPPAQAGEPGGRPLGPRMPALSGRFDELSGELDVIDLTNPTYDCRVTLIEAD
jgi:hypothetical protein